MRTAVLSLSIVGALLAQSAVFPHLTIFGLKPDLLMVVVACWGLLYGPSEGFVAGLVAGLLQDVAFGQYIGLFALAKTLVGFGAGVVAGKIFRETIWVPTVAVGAAVFVHELVIWVCLRALGLHAPALNIVTVGFPVAVYSTVMAPLIYRQFFIYYTADRARDKEMTGGSSPAAARR